MIARLEIAAIDQSAAHPVQHIVIFRMHHRQAAMPAGHRENVKKLRVRNASGVGHEHLEGGNAPRKDIRQLRQHLRRRICQDEMVGPVENRFQGRAVIIGLNRAGKALAGLLGGKGHETGIAAEGGGYRTGFIIIRRHDAHAAFLRDMTMRLDTARHHDTPCRIDHIICVRDRLGEGGDTTVSNADIGVKCLCRGSNKAAADCQIMSHDHPFVPSG